MAWAAPITMSGPTTEPVSLADAKAFVSIDADETEFDGLIEGFLVAARQHAENMTGVRLGEQQVELLADSFADLVRLPVGPVTEVTALRMRGSDGAITLIDPDDYELTGSGLTRGLRPAPGHSWPQGALMAQGVQVTATVGFDPLPRPLWLAVLLMTADQFAHRETAVTGTIAAKIPTSMQVDALLGNYRIWL